MVCVEEQDKIVAGGGSLGKQGCSARVLARHHLGVHGGGEIAAVDRQCGPDGVAAERPKPK